MLKIRSLREFIAELQEESLSKTKRMAVKGLGFVYLWRTQLLKDRCPQRAASLTYTTLLAIFPLIALIALFVPAFFGNLQEMEDEVIQRLETLLIPDAGLQVEAEITKYFDLFRDNSRFVGLFGIIGLMLSAIVLFAGVETSFNDIWRARRRRSWVRVFSNFATVLVSVPILIGASLFITAWLTQRVGILGQHFALLLPYLMTCTAMTLAFYILPNTRVKLLYALIGGIFAALAWEIVKVSFGYYMAHPRIKLFLKSLGAIPIFLIWIYVSWLVVLVGCELAYLLQNYRRLEFETFRKRPYTIMDSKLLFLVFVVIADHFQRGLGSINFAGMLSKIPLKVEEMEEALKLLREAKLVKETLDGEFMLARPLDNVTPAEVLALGCEADSLFLEEPLQDSPITRAIGQLQHSILQWSAGRSFKEVLASSELAPRQGMAET